MALPRVLVLVAVHNGLPWLEEQLASLAAQTGVVLLVDLGDDASTDGSAAILADWVRRDARFRLQAHSVPSGGAAASFFRLLAAADLADVDYLAFCDQDDRWHADRLSAGVQALKDAGADLYSSATQAFWPDGRQRRLSQVAAITRADFLFEGAGQGCSFLLTRAAAVRVQRAVRAQATLLPALHYHDWAVYAAIRAFDLEWVFDPQPRLDYRQHQANDTGARASGEGVRRRLALIRSGWYRAQVEAITAWVAALRPDHPAVNGWRACPGRFARVCWLLRNGRRRPADRAVQLVAAAVGWL